MSTNINNKCSFIGRVVRDPILRKTNTSEKPVTSFSLAVERSYKDKDGQKPVDFIDFVAWGARAEYICKNWHQGDLVTIDGPLQNLPYNDKDGKSRIAAEIVVNCCRKLSAKGKNAPPTEPTERETPPPPTDEDFIELENVLMTPFDIPDDIYNY